MTLQCLLRNNSGGEWGREDFFKDTTTACNAFRGTMM